MNNNILTYAKYRKDLTFHQMPFNEADAVAFSCLSYLDYTGIFEGEAGISEIAGKYKSEKLSFDENYKFNDKELLLFEMGDSKRYKNVRIANYKKEINQELEMTHYACTFYLNPFDVVVAFPGTDESLLSWKENFVYLYRIPAPGQEKCKDYLTQVLKRPFVKVRLVGHSKGGTLAAYAAMNVESKLQKKIADIYLLDAPGFIYDANEKPGFLAIKGKIRRFVPEDSVIGKLFKVPYGDPVVIKSFKDGFEQHELVNWCMSSNGAERAAATSEFSDKNARIINDLVESVPQEEKEATINEFFDVFFKNGFTTIDQVSNMNVGKGIKLLLAYLKLSPHTKNVLNTLLKEMKQ